MRRPRSSAADAQAGGRADAVGCSISTRRCAYVVEQRGLGPSPEGAVAADGALPRPARADRAYGAAARRRTPRACCARCSPTTPTRWRRSTASNEIDFSYTVDGLARFRVNAFRQRGSVSIVARVIPFTVRTIDELGLPPVIEKIADEERGLILLTGTTGSGKSTTLAAMIDHINVTHGRATSSRSRTRSSICTATAARSSTSARSAWTPRRSAAPCAGCCARTRT